jgi:small subunit ribosomal protein S16
LVKIRLKRVGKKKQPSYRVVVADSRFPRDGRIIESIGHYQPRQEPSEIVIDNDRAVHWLKVGAQPTEQARKLLELSGAWTDFTGKPVAAKATSPKKATPAGSVKATPAASVSAEEAPEVADAPPAETPEAVDQAPAAPEAEGDGSESPQGTEGSDEAPTAEAGEATDEGKN